MQRLTAMKLKKAKSEIVKINPLFQIKQEEEEETKTDD